MLSHLILTPRLQSGDKRQDEEMSVKVLLNFLRSHRMDQAGLQTQEGLTSNPSTSCNTVLLPQSKAIAEIEFSHSGCLRVLVNSMNKMLIN